MTDSPESADVEQPEAKPERATVDWVEYFGVSFDSLGLLLDEALRA